MTTFLLAAFCVSHCTLYRLHVGTGDAAKNTFEPSVRLPMRSVQNDVRLKCCACHAKFVYQPLQATKMQRGGIYSAHKRQKDNLPPSTKFQSQSSGRHGCKSSLGIKLLSLGKLATGTAIANPNERLQTVAANGCESTRNVEQMHLHPQIHEVKRELPL